MLIPRLNHRQSVIIEGALRLANSTQLYRDLTAHNCSEEIEQIGGTELCELLGIVQADRMIGPGLDFTMPEVLLEVLLSALEVARDDDLISLEAAGMPEAYQSGDLSDYLERTKRAERFDLAYRILNSVKRRAENHATNPLGSSISDLSGDNAGSVKQQN